MQPNILVAFVSTVVASLTAAVVDPNIQVAFISVLGIAVSTAGVIAVAFINRTKERDGAASEGVDSALDERDILGRMLALIAENERKEATIAELKAENAALRAEKEQGEAHDGTPHH